MENPWNVHSIIKIEDENLDDVSRNIPMQYENTLKHLKTETTDGNIETCVKVEAVDTLAQMDDSILQYIGNTDKEIVDTSLLNKKDNNFKGLDQTEDNNFQTSEDPLNIENAEQRMVNKNSKMSSSKKSRKKCEFSCAHPFCSYKGSKNLVKFPHAFFKPDLRKKWMKMCGMYTSVFEQVNDSIIEKIYYSSLKNKAKLCSRHFLPKDLKNSTGQFRVKADAIPIKYDVSNEFC